MSTIEPHRASLAAPEFNKVFLESKFSEYDVPNLTSVIVKSECVFSCDSPSSPNGVFVNLKTFTTVGWDFVQTDAKKTMAELFLNIKNHYECEDEKPVEKLALDIPGSFREAGIVTKVEYGIYFTEHNLLFTLPLEPTVEKLKELGLNDKLSSSIATIINHPSSTAVPVPWEEKIEASHYANDLVQIENPPLIPLSQWRCQSCSNTKNLWMNLTDGYIGCGRKLHGVEDSGCLTGEEGAAVRHYEEQPKCRPLAVKLGTLTPSSADIYSYKEDSMVHDPKLSEHLEHFGINLRQTQKSEKTMTEMELEYNRNFDWNRVVEADADLTPLTKGAAGLVNFGNTCYINAILQGLSSIHELRKPLEEVWKLLVERITAREGERDLVLQLAKIFSALRGDVYSKQRDRILDSMDPGVRKLYEQENPSVSISPLRFRNIICCSHPEFSTSRQQDAEEFLRYLIQTVSVSMSNHSDTNVASKSHLINDVFEFEIEEKLKVSHGNKTKITTLSESILSLPLPQPTSTDEEFEAIDTKRRKATEKTPELDFKKCFEDWMEGETVEMRVEDKKELVTGFKTRKIKTFPPVLIVQLKRFFLASDWTAKKIASPVSMPEMLDLTPYRASGLRSGEVEWVEPEKHSELYQQIEAMGFSKAAARKAVAQSTGIIDLESCIQWILSNLDDPSLNENQESSGGSAAVNHESALLSSLGFQPLQIKAAMISAKGDENLALEWLMSEERIDAVCQSICEQVTRPKQPARKRTDGTGKYKLIGIISHMGANASCGHYVCHARGTDGKWIIFNDTKIAESKNLPITFGYLFIYHELKD